ncbi:MAG: hypothetical protein IPP74_13495 [Alphaproteobacteria bacterium]|nr:hypothetical protein [Alphaproteobacteria bacterium]
MKYRVIRNCYGFKGRYWSKDQIVEVDGSEIPPEHFDKIEQIQPIEIEKVDEHVEPTVETNVIVEKKQKHKRLGK